MNKLLAKKAYISEVKMDEIKKRKSQTNIKANIKPKKNDIIHESSTNKKKMEKQKEEKSDKDKKLSDIKDIKEKREKNKGKIRIEYELKLKEVTEK